MARQLTVIETAILFAALMAAGYGVDTLRGMAIGACAALLIVVQAVVRTLRSNQQE